MNIRLKVIAVLALLFAVLSGVAIAVELQVVMPSFARLERENAQTSLKRARYAMTRTLEAVLGTTLDWANWAEVYRFVQDHNRDFITTNITHNAMQQVQVNTILVVDLDGRIVLNTGNVLNTGLSLEPGLLSGPSLREDFPWRKLLGKNESATGLVRTNLGVLMIAGSPILDGSGGGKPLGLVIMGRLFTPARVRGVGFQTQADVTKLDDLLPAGSERIVETDAVTRVLGSFEDVYGRPVMTLRVDVPREITASGRTAIRVASVSLVAAAVVVLILVLLLLNRLVLEPLTRMTRHAVAIGEGADLTARLNFNSNDEIGRLAREFDHMVERLAATRRQLVDQSFQAGFAEMAKGVLHNLGNAMTPLGVRLAALEKRMRAVPVADLEQAAAELATGAADAARAGDASRRAALAQFIELGCREMAGMVRDAEADIAVMQRQTTIMRGSLTEQMRSTSSEPVVEPVRLPELVAQSLEIVPDVSRQRLQVDADESLQRVGVVRVARTVLRLILQNLIINAADAVRDAGKAKGVLRVAAEIVREADRDQLHLHCDDNGVGIPGDHLERVFEKGFSTKSRETNQGIGLHWCANAVRALGGRIWAASDGPGLGASLHLILPLGARETGSMS